MDICQGYKWVLDLYLVFTFPKTVNEDSFLYITSPAFIALCFDDLVYPDWCEKNSQSFSFLLVCLFLWLFLIFFCFFKIMIASFSHSLSSLQTFLVSLHSSCSLKLMASFLFNCPHSCLIMTWTRMIQIDMEVGKLRDFNHRQRTTGN